MKLALPHWIVWDAPCLATVPGPVHRASCQLAVAYWRSGCQPLPTDNATLAALCRIPTAHFPPIRSAVDAVLAIVLPKLAEAHASNMATYAYRVERGHKLTAIRQAKRARVEPTAPSHNPASTLPALRGVPADVPAAHVLEQEQRVAKPRGKQRTFTD